MTGYTVVIKECNKELTARERLILKDTSDCIKLDEATQQGEVVINPTMYAVLDVHNEKSDNKDYNVFIIVDEDGTKYVTGSESFYSSFKNIYDEMGDEPFSIKAYRLPSKNRAGKDFITCSII